MLDRDKFLVVSEHGFLIQLEKGGIRKCGHYRGSYECGKARRDAPRLDRLPKGCPVLTEDNATTLCPIIWLLTCTREGIVEEEDAVRIMTGEVTVASYKISTEGRTAEGKPKEEGKREDDEFSGGCYQIGGEGNRDDGADAPSAQGAHSDVERGAPKDDTTAERERAKSLWLEVEGRSRAQDERTAQLDRGDAGVREREEALSKKEAELNASLAKVKEREDSAKTKEEELAVRAERLRKREEGVDAGNRVGSGGEASVDEGYESRISTLDAREREIAEREKRVAEAEAEVGRMRAEAAENQEKALKLLELVKKKDAKVTKKIMALNKVQLEGGAPSEAENELE